MTTCSRYTPTPQHPYTPDWIYIVGLVNFGILSATLNLKSIGNCDFDKGLKFHVLGLP